MGSPKDSEKRKEWIKNISKAKKGSIGYWKGKKRVFTEEHKENLRLAMEGSKQTEEHKGKRDLFNQKGKSYEERYGIEKAKKIKNKLSKCRKGRKHPDDCRCPFCKGDELVGNKNGNWKGGKSFEPYPIGWNRRYKEQIRYRDENTCQLCGILEIESSRKLCVHHKDYNKDNIESNNLISLCLLCHIKTNSNRKYWKEYFNAK